MAIKEAGSGARVRVDETVEVYIEKERREETPLDRIENPRIGRAMQLIRQGMPRGYFIRCFDNGKNWNLKTHFTTRERASDALWHLWIKSNKGENLPGPDEVIFLPEISVTAPPQYYRRTPEKFAWTDQIVQLLRKLAEQVTAENPGITKVKASRLILQMIKDEELPGLEGVTSSDAIRHKLSLFSELFPKNLPHNRRSAWTEEAIIALRKILKTIRKSHPQIKGNPLAKEICLLAKNGEYPLLAGRTAAAIQNIISRRGL